MADRIFILGSGFSKSFSDRMPTIKDLTDRLFRLNEQHYPGLVPFVRDLYDKSNELPDIRNIENITNIIFSKQVFRDFEEQMDYEKLKFEMIKFIHNEIRHPKLDEAKSDTLYRFLRCCAYEDNMDKKDSIITFNYDLIIEDILRERNQLEEETIGLWYGLKFEKYRHTQVTDRLESYTHQLELLKLHGSFNWFRAKGSDSNDIRNIYLVDDRESMFAIHKTDIPTYIPMSDVKALFLNGTLYSTLWAMTINLLNDCNEIIYIGYGFPTTDLNNLGLFLDYKDKIKYINVDEPSNSLKLRRLLQLFGKERIMNMDAKKFIEEVVL